MIIDCGSCVVSGPACGDCVVSVLLGIPEIGLADEGGQHRVAHLPADARAVPGARELPDEHAAAVAVLAESGLVPPLRLVSGARAS